MNLHNQCSVKLSWAPSADQRFWADLDMFLWTGLNLDVVLAKDGYCKTKEPIRILLSPKYTSFFFYTYNSVAMR